MLVCLFALRIQCIPVFGLVHFASAWLIAMWGYSGSKHFACTRQHGIVGSVSAPVSNLFIFSPWAGPAWQCLVFMLQVGNIFNQAWFVPCCEGIVLARAGKLFSLCAAAVGFTFMGELYCQSDRCQCSA